MDFLSQQITLVLIGSAFFILVAVGIIVLFLVYQKKQLQMLIQKQQLQNQFNQELLNTRLEVQEHTLNKVSQEIHDNIGQVLSLVKLNLNKELATENSNKTTIQTTKDLVQRAIEDLRTLSKTLNSGYLIKNPLSESLKHDLRIIEQSGICKTMILVEGEEQELSDQKKLVLYRMAQELLNNSIKHARASHIQIFLNYSEDQLLLKVEDDGVGFITSQSTNGPSGTGIDNLFFRAKLIGGQFSIGNGQSKGTSAQISVPLD